MLWCDLTIAKIRAGLRCRITARRLRCRQPIRARGDRGSDWRCDAAWRSCRLQCRVTVCQLRCRQPICACDDRGSDFRSDGLSWLLRCDDAVGASDRDWVAAAGWIAAKRCDGVGPSDRLGCRVATRDAAPRAQSVYYSLLGIVERRLIRRQGCSGSGGEGRSGCGIRRGGVGHCRRRLAVCDVRDHRCLPGSAIGHDRRLAGRRQVAVGCLGRADGAVGVC